MCIFYLMIFLNTVFVYNFSRNLIVVGELEKHFTFARLKKQCMWGGVGGEEGFSINGESKLFLPHYK